MKLVDCLWSEDFLNFSSLVLHFRAPIKLHKFSSHYFLPPPPPPLPPKLGHSAINEHHMLPEQQHKTYSYL